MASGCSIGGGIKNGAEIAQRSARFCLCVSCFNFVTGSSGEWVGQSVRDPVGLVGGEAVE